MTAARMARICYNFRVLFEDIKNQIQDAVDFEIENIELLGSGMANTAYVVNDAWVFRFADIASAKDALIKELKTLPVLAEALPVGIPVPVFSSTAPGRAYFGGYRMLPGVSLTRERFDQLEQNVQNQLLQEFHEFLDSLHAVDPASVPELQEAPFVGAYNPGQRHFHDSLHSIIGTENVGKVEAIFLAHESDPANQSSGPAVIHSDLKPAHMLFAAESGHLTGILDWGDSALGDPDYDFVVVEVFFGHDFLNRLLDCGPKRDKSRILRKAPFLTLVRALQDLMLNVIEHDNDLIGPALRNLESKLDAFDENGIGKSHQV
jgi:aminoglycoside 2''-phosphotransferase